MRQHRPAIPKVNVLARMFNNHVVQREPKRADPLYLTQQYAIWRQAVAARAGYRCQAVDNGRRCRKAMPDHRLFADHVVELQDGGAAFDPANGQCLCGAHHTVKTMAARAKRLSIRG